MPDPRYSNSNAAASVPQALRDALEQAVPGGAYYRERFSYGLAGTLSGGGMGAAGDFDDPGEDPATNEFSDRFTVADGATVRYELSDNDPCHVEGTIAVIRNGKQKAAFFVVLSDGTTPKFSFSGAGVNLPGGSAGDETKVAITAEIHSSALKIKLVNSGAAAMTATVDISFKVKKW